MRRKTKRFSIAAIGPHCKIAEQFGCVKPDARDTKKARRDAGNIWHETLRQHLVDAGLNPISEYTNIVPERRFRADLAFPEDRLAIEIDGWQYHGKTLGSFKNDRKRQNLMVVHGWRILRFFPGEIAKSPGDCVDTILQALLCHNAKE